MILLSPIWSPDTLAQVVKRIHRIGQTRPTTVQTVVIRGTIEEDIANRETSKGSAEEEDIYSRAMIKVCPLRRTGRALLINQNPRFVYGSNQVSHPTPFIVNLIPTSERELPPSTPPHTSLTSASVSPTSPQLLTPGGETTAVEAHWMFGDAEGSAVALSKKRGSVEDSESRPEKRRKGVTFA